MLATYFSFFTGIEALLTTLRPQVDSALQEAGLDSLCKLAAESDNRQRLSDKVLPAITCSHGTGQVDDSRTPQTAH